MRRTILGLALVASALTGCGTGPVEPVSADIPGGIAYTMPNGDQHTCQDWHTYTGTECTGNPVQDIPAVVCPFGFRVDGPSVACLPRGWDAA